MHRYRRRFALLTTTGAAMFLGGVVGPAAAAVTRYVDDDKAQCPTAAFTTIQAAVTASSAGDTIIVCDGTYTEQVAVPPGKDGLKLQTQDAQGAKIKLPDNTATQTDATGVDIQSKNVLFRGFYVTGPSPNATSGCQSSDYQDGIHIRNGASATVDQNTITAVRSANPVLFGCQFGRAIKIDSASSADINNNTIDNYQKNGIDIRDAGTSALVQNNTIVGEGPNTFIAQNGIVIVGGATANIRVNLIRDNEYTSNPATTGTTATGILPSSPGAGLQMYANTLKNNDVGIGATLMRNIVRYSNDQGLLIESDSTGNTLSNNTSLSNGMNDCEDDSPPSPSGTPPTTSNTWTGNHGTTQNKAGLCS
jgi:hypothetical protein